jgi:hypothetical protein
VLLGGASTVSIIAACAGNIVSVAPVSCDPQVMLYVTLPLSSGGSLSRPLFGLRIGELSKRPTTTQLVATPPNLRELIDVQVAGHSELRMAIGRRLVWNITRGAFGPQSSPVAVAKFRDALSASFSTVGRDRRISVIVEDRFGHHCIDEYLGIHSRTSKFSMRGVGCARSDVGLGSFLTPIPARITLQSFAADFPTTKSSVDFR